MSLLPESKLNTYNNNQIQGSEEKGFQAALLLNVPIFGKEMTNSPNFDLNISKEEELSYQNFLPGDLIDKIGSISPAQQNSPKPSEKQRNKITKIIDSKNSSSDDDDDIILSQYENIMSHNSNKPNNNLKLDANITHKSSTNSENISFKNQEKLNLLGQKEIVQMPFLNAYYNTMGGGSGLNGDIQRKYSEPIQNWMISTYLMNTGSNNSIKNGSSRTSRKSTDGLSDKSSTPQNKPEVSKKRSKKKKENNEYTLEMFGRRGWICEQCNNFNYESRNKCNRCGIPKQPKILREKKEVNNQEVKEEKIKKSERKGDWNCYNCKNLNFSFRLVCNRCQMSKEDSDKRYEAEVNVNSKKEKMPFFVSQQSYQK